MISVSLVVKRINLETLITIINVKAVISNVNNAGNYNLF